MQAVTCQQNLLESEKHSNNRQAILLLVQRCPKLEIPLLTIWRTTCLVDYRPHSMRFASDL